MTKQVDFESYTKFVDAVTSDLHDRDWETPVPLF